MQLLAAHGSCRAAVPGLHRHRKRRPGRGGLCRRPLPRSWPRQLPPGFPAAQHARQHLQRLPHPRQLLAGGG